ncbi:MAG: DNA repair exonuclease, partial [Oscillospiraceae bacterium]|nr:DNA repair exonuclease [Oscillospiraceae bacterium]
RYEILTVDVSGKDAETALRAALPGRTADDLYRVIFAGESDERGVDLARLYERLAPEFFHLELRDSTRIAEDVWARAEEDSLRGLFLRDLRTQMEGADEAQREKIVLAARYGLAALDGRDL